MPTINNIYEKPLETEIYNQHCKILRLFEKYLDTVKISKEYINVNYYSLNELLIRIDMRKEYYMIFHETEISELKCTALIVFWLLKFKPFSIKDDNNISNELNKIKINESFSIYLFLSIVKKILKKEGKKFEVNEDYINKLSYALCFWDLSKEATIFIVETFYESLKNR